MRQKVFPLEQLQPLLDKEKDNNKKIVTTNGVFDILHIGHIRYLQEAKALGDILVIAINTDASVKKIKGPKRPLNNEQDRAEALAALSCVDYVTFFEDETPIPLLEKLRPNIHVKGGDYTPDQLPEKETVEKNGGQVKVLQNVKGYSTTDLIQRILGAYKE